LTSKEDEENMYSRPEGSNSRRFYRLYYFKSFYYKGEYLRVALILSNAIWENNLVTIDEF